MRGIETGREAGDARGKRLDSRGLHELFGVGGRQRGVNGAGARMG